jgi:biopolymer transport protein ExbD/biopolymer transport protein TolR
MGAAILASTGAASKRRDATPEINVTPLVDVVLVLLIIFMVIAPALEHGERVELPAILKPDPKQKSKTDPVTVTLTASGKYFLEKEPVEPAALKERLVQLHAQDPDKRVVLKGDATVSYAQMRDLFGVAQESGFSGIALLVSKKKGQGKEDDDGS